MRLQGHQVSVDAVQCIVFTCHAGWAVYPSDLEQQLGRRCNSGRLHNVLGAEPNLAEFVKRDLLMDRQIAEEPLQKSLVRLPPIGQHHVGVSLGEGIPVRAILHDTSFRNLHRVLLQLQLLVDLEGHQRLAMTPHSRYFSKLEQLHGTISDLLRAEQRLDRSLKGLQVVR